MQETTVRRTLSTALVRIAAACLIAPLATIPAAADGGVTFEDIVNGSGAGVTYERTPSARNAVREAFIAEGTIPASDLFRLTSGHPLKPAGSPGVALLDYDADGDLDIYVTNGPGSANSLYSNQFVDSGTVTFVDVAAAAGVEATAQDSSGVCFGDVDNDGDPDLFVLGSGDPYHLFENQGDGTFTDISAASGAAFAGRWSLGCSMADFDGDGLLDITVANSYTDWSNRAPVVTPSVSPFNEHTELFVNQGGNVFAELAEVSGLHQVSNLPDAAFSWAIGAVDLDQDGDADIVVADNQGRPPVDKADERGYNRWFQNDGTGQFQDVSFAAELDEEGGWMGLTFADFDCNGEIDFFSTNTGSYLGGERASSSLFYQGADHTFDRWDFEELGANPFGWGVSAFDYDNDGDSDLIYHGTVDNVISVVAENPGVLYQNTGVCSGVLEYDADAVLRNHNTRTVQGVAVGDLDNDGFEDIVTVSNFDIVPGNFFPWVPFLGPPRDPEFDLTARFEVEWFQLSPGVYTWVGPTLPNGTLAVELNSGDNGNGWTEFETVGGVGLVPGGSVNRDGIGAVVRFTPDGGPTSILPVIGGSSYASQDSLAVNFGLGQATQGTVEVLWPGGVVNRVYDVQSGERLVLPEIPCDADGDWKNFGQYNSCVMQALNGYKGAGVIDSAMKNRLRDSARRAFDE